MKEIVLLCPLNVQTGGPEAIHQLANELNDLGYNPYIFYTIGSDFNSLQEIKNSYPDIQYIEIPERINGIDAYIEYKVKCI